MRSKPLPVLLVLAVLLSQVPFTFGQPPTMGDWSAVQQLKTDTKLVITQKSGHEIKGSMIEASDTSLTIDRKGKPLTIARSDIRQIYVIQGKAEKGMWSLIGAGIGAGAGAGIGAVKYSPNSDDSEIYISMGLLIGTGVGAVSGLLFGQSKRRRELVFSE